ncbi:MAG TPA: hypothetical protein VL123_05895, partial [Candidatus Udaeobacter sp.]|nr:hypothetical protein [Candidatus Udaeobacter sp.]
LFEARDPQAIAFAETLSSLRPRLLVLNDDPATLELRAASDPIRALFGSGYGYEGSVDAYHLYRAAQGRNPALP